MLHNFTEIQIPKSNCIFTFIMYDMYSSYVVRIHVILYNPIGRFYLIYYTDASFFVILQIHPSHKAMYMSFGGKEIAHKHYEVLVTV